MKERRHKPPPRTKAEAKTQAAAVAQGIEDVAEVTVATTRAALDAATASKDRSRLTAALEELEEAMEDAAEAIRDALDGLQEAETSHKKATIRLYQNRHK